jgi:hypothetical protein
MSTTLAPAPTPTGLTLGELDVLAAWISTHVGDPIVLETRGPEAERLEIVEGYRENNRRNAAAR